MDATLLYALLAMDSYNRGVGAGLRIGKEDDPRGETIANATIQDATLNSIADREALARGFYAVGYQLDGGAKVMAVRGTDDFGTDVPNGYGVALGAPGAPQALYAADFYQRFVGPGAGPTNAVLTGHSMGAGLAGYVAAL